MRTTRQHVRRQRAADVHRNQPVGDATFAGGDLHHHGSARTAPRRPVHAILDIAGWPAARRPHRPPAPVRRLARHARPTRHRARLQRQINPRIGAIQHRRRRDRALSRTVPASPPPRWCHASPPPAVHARGAASVGPWTGKPRPGTAGAHADRRMAAEVVIEDHDAVHLSARVRLSGCDPFGTASVWTMNAACRSMQYRQRSAFRFRWR